MSAAEIGWHQLAPLDAWPPGVAALTCSLRDKEWLRLAMGPVIWFEGNCPLMESLIDLVCEVAASSQHQITRYLSATCELSELLPTILDRSRKFRQAVGRDTCLRDLRSMELAVDGTVMELLRTLPPRRTWRILAFGGGDCSYERSIGERLAAKSSHGNFVLYRFDPEVSTAADGVIDISLEHCAGDCQVNFDIVVCRWVLHHVPKVKRWKNLANAIQKLCQDGALVLVEEGDFSPYSEQTPARRAYRLVVACEDILVNGILRPRFVDTLGDSRTAGFQLEYLAQEDLLTIEDHLSAGMKRYMYSPGPPGKFGEAVIVYA